MSAELEMKPEKSAKLEVWRVILLALPTRSMIDTVYKARSVAVPPHPSSTGNKEVGVSI